MTYKDVAPWYHRLLSDFNEAVFERKLQAFKLKYKQAREVRAQKKIYFWIIPRLYRPGSESAKRLAEKSWQATLKEMINEGL